MWGVCMCVRACVCVCVCAHTRACVCTCTSTSQVGLFHMCGEGGVLQRFMGAEQSQGPYTKVESPSWEKVDHVPLRRG